MAFKGKTLIDLGLSSSDRPLTLIEGLAVDNRDVKKGYLFIGNIHRGYLAYGQIFYFWCTVESI